MKSKPGTTNHLAIATGDTPAEEGSHRGHGPRAIEEHASTRGANPASPSTSASVASSIVNAESATVFVSPDNQVDTMHRQNGRMPTSNNSIPETENWGVNSDEIPAATNENTTARKLSLELDDMPPYAVGNDGMEISNGSGVKLGGAHGQGHRLSNGHDSTKASTAKSETSTRYEKEIAKKMQNNQAHQSQEDNSFSKKQTRTRGSIEYTRDDTAPPLPLDVPVVSFHMTHNSARALRKEQTDDTLNHKLNDKLSDAASIDSKPVSYSPSKNSPAAMRKELNSGEGDTTPSEIHDIHVAFLDEKIRKKSSITSENELSGSISGSGKGPRRNSGNNSNKVFPLPELEEPDPGMAPPNAIKDEDLNVSGHSNGESSHSPQEEVFIPDAYVVDEETGHGKNADNGIDECIVDAQVMEIVPWYKQRHSRILFGVVCVLIVASAIAVGVSFSLSGNDSSSANSSLGETGVGVSEGEPAEFPPVPPPTPASPKPTSSPTPMPTIPCRDQHLNAIEELEIPLTNPSPPELALDGNNAVVVTGDYDTRKVYLLFYSNVTNLDEEHIDLHGLDTSPIWSQGQPVEEPYGEMNLFKVAIHGKRAIVGFPYASIVERESTTSSGAAFVYEQNEFGLWEKMEIDSNLPSSLSSSLMLESSAILPNMPAYDPFNSISYSEEECNRFGGAVDIHENVILVGDRCGDKGYFVNILVWMQNGNSPGRWKHIEKMFGWGGRFEGSEGDVISMMTYDGVQFYQLVREEHVEDGTSSVTGVVPLAKSLDVDDYLKMIFYRDYLVYSYFDGVYIYHRGSNATATGDVATDASGIEATSPYSQPFALVQFMNASDYAEGFGDDIAFDNNGLLVVASEEESFIFVQQLDGSWSQMLVFGNEEILGGTEPEELSVELSGRSVLFGTETQVFSMRIGSCIHSMPELNMSQSDSLAPSSLSTQSASPSLAPSTTSAPTSTQVPTPAPSSTDSPTSSFQPTSPCHLVQIVIAFDKFPEEISWEIERLNDSGVGGVVVKSLDEHEYPVNATVVETVCLTDGVYEFIMYDSYGDGLTDGYGSYNLTSNGQVIAQGSTFEYEESTLFEIPFSAAPATQSTAATTTGATTTGMTTTGTSTIIATSTTTSDPSAPLDIEIEDDCYSVQLTVTFDNSPSGIGWILTKRLQDSTYEMIENYYNSDASLANATEIRSFCLPGDENIMYKFTIYDAFGNGLCCEDGNGSYRLEANGAVVAEGGDFESNQEVVEFYLPFDPENS